ncbi:MAG: hypothetical protein QM714_08735 [Nocardioides sp.]|uniref:hypothetical protein n=1 Tax=Nocardioides sp. TaxID=35761 RepID=UPI0039E4E288
MSNIAILAANPSSICVPTYGRAFGMSARLRADVLEVSDLRGITGEHTFVKPTATGVARGDFWGTSAWRPPIC